MYRVVGLVVALVTVLSLEAWAFGRKDNPFVSHGYDCQQGFNGGFNCREY